jgi:hypothetical protein
MGSIVALDGTGKGVLVTAATQAAPFSILLHDVDIASTMLTGSVARRGSYKAQSLIVSVGVDGAILEKSLRDAGIYLEGGWLSPQHRKRQPPHEASRRRHPQGPLLRSWPRA